MSAFSTVVESGIATVTLDLPGESLNKITRAVRDELEPLLSELGADAGVQAVVLISGKPDTFIAGADIDEFVALKTREEAHALVRGGQALIERLASLGKPVVAAIHGACVGGGLETALACTYRVATDHPKTSLGLPEILLGILPAAGGCQRLPRLVGVPAALDMILAGKVVPARRAYRMGIVDELVHPAMLPGIAAAAARRLASGWRPKRRKGGLMARLLGGNPVGRAVAFRQARRQVLRRTQGNYPAPLAAIDAVAGGLAGGIAAGLQREAGHFADLAVGDVSRNLVQVFFARNALKKDMGVSGDIPDRAPVESLGIVGAGFMGAAIGATAALKAEVDVRFRDADLGRVGAGLAAAGRILRDRLQRRRMTRFEHRRVSALLSGGVDLSGFGRTDLVIEAVFEDLDVKRNVFAELEDVVREDCVLASNTSTIPIGSIAQGLGHPERVLGMHFFSPVEKMPLLEVIVTDTTAPWATAAAVAFGRRMGKDTIVVADRPGFWVNRILSPYLNEAGLLIREGVPIEHVDRIMKRFGFPVGPITLLDEIGLDVAVKAAGVMHQAFGDRMKPDDGVSRLVRAGRIGRKGGSGFYSYKKGKRRGVDESVYEVLDVKPHADSDHHVVSDGDIENRLAFSMLNEAASALDEGVVRSPRDGDLGAIMGIGYPPFRGGPLRYLDSIGLGLAVETLVRLSETYGRRFRPAPLLERMAAADERFYPTS